MEFVGYSDWRQLPENADLLFDQGATSSVFFSRPWLENLQRRALENGQSMLLACVIDREKVLAVLPLMHQNDRHLVGLTNLYSSLHGLLLVDDNRQAIVECLARGIDRMSIASLKLDPVAEDDRNVLLLQQCMQSIGYQCHRRFRFHNWIHRVQGQSFAAYMAGRPSRVRNTIARKQRKLQREHGYAIRLYTDQDLDQALADYDSVYRASWKANEQFEDFIQGLAWALAGPGWLRLAVLYIAGQPAAAQFWFVVRGKASIFKLVYDEAWKQYSPGSILISYLMQQVIEIDEVDEIDFLTGNDAYKQDWMSERRQRDVLSFFRPDRPKRGIAQLAASLKNTFSTNR